MNKLLLLPSILFCGFFQVSTAQIISTVAGNGTQGYSGDGGQATAAELTDPNAVGFDKAGNMYIADEGIYRIRKVSLAGIISTVAGNGTGGYSGDGGQATAAEINAPEDVQVDKFGNVYIADLLNQRVRKVSTSGVITTFAGTGAGGFSGDGGLATAAQLQFAYRLAIDTIGNVYIADQGNERIRVVNTNGIINTFAGNGTGAYNGDGGQATAAEIKTPGGLAIDATGNVYISDGGNHRIRMVSTNGIISTVAGNGVGGFSGDGGLATTAELNYPFGIAVDAFGDMYINDQGNQRIRSVNAAGVISTYAGTGAAGYNGDGIPATTAEIDDAWDVNTDAAGNVYISDEVNYRVRKVPGNPLSIGPITSELSVSLYPNPNNGIFQLGIKNHELGIEKSVEIYNAVGKKIYSAQLSIVNSTLSIDVSNQPAGIYFYRLISADGQVTASGKFVIE
jgi:sugar lactone lactonase YvrE